MISCSLMGGLGNQLFQIFATIAYAIENEKPFGFLYSENSEGITFRTTYWGSFLQSLKFFTHKNVSADPVQREKGFEYTKLDPLLNGEDLMLIGYFQSYKYFYSYFQTICKLIKFENIRAQIIKKYSFNSDSISMHFRIGDYKQLTDFHPIQEYDYYEKALQFIINKKNDDSKIEEIKTEVLYFCEKQDNDDVSKIIERMQDKFPMVGFTKANDEIEDWEQMVMMSCCKHNIIANSTFSWWGAYFNQNLDKIVCYPSKWFGTKNAHLDTCDLFPNDWVSI